MGTRNRQGPAGRDVVLRKVTGFDSQVRTVLPIEDVWKRVFVANAKNDESRQTRRICYYMTDVDAFMCQRLPDEPSHVFIADPREH